LPITSEYHKSSAFSEQIIIFLNVENFPKKTFFKKKSVKENKKMEIKGLSMYRTYFKTTLEV
jgi:hypothetical protein